MQWLAAALAVSALASVFASEALQRTELSCDSEDDTCEPAHGQSTLQVAQDRDTEKTGVVEESELGMASCSQLLRFSCQGKTDLATKFVSYPTNKFTQEVARTSNAVSVRRFWQVEGSFKNLLNSISPLTKPTQPEDGQAFWHEFDQITKLQVDRRAGGMAADKMKLPQMFQSYTMEQGAAAVEADFPSKFPTALVEQFLAEGVEFDATIVPHFTADDFVNKVVMLARLIGWAVSTVSPTAFASKWHQGRPRPEEVAKAIVDGNSLVADAPADVVSRVKALGLSKPGAVDYTAYSNGAPRHPSWPAMHSAASTASVYLPVVLNLTASQLQETIRLDCAVATFRSFAGVHYESDNMAGLAIGQEVIRRELPRMLRRNYGSTASAVREKLAKVIDEGHDWRTASSCLSA